MRLRLADKIFYKFLDLFCPGVVEEVAARRAATEVPSDFREDWLDFLATDKVLLDALKEIQLRLEDYSDYSTEKSQSKSQSEVNIKEAVKICLDPNDPRRIIATGRKGKVGFDIYKMSSTFIRIRNVDEEETFISWHPREKRWTLDANEKRRQVAKDSFLRQIRGY